MNHLIFTQDWEKELQRKLLFQPASNDKWAYICSPLRADRKEQTRMHMRAASAYMYYSEAVLGIPAKAPHAFMPYLLNDGIPSERALALDFGLRLLGQSRMLLICGDRISSGMQDEIAYALRLNIQIVAFNAELIPAVNMIAKTETGGADPVRWNLRHPVMGMSAAELDRFLNPEERNGM